MPSSRRIDFSREAEDDIRGILAYSLAEWGETQRDAYAAALDAAFQRLIDFPEFGRSHPESFPGCRTLPVERHIVFYRLDGATIRIVRVLHAKLDAARLLGSSEPPTT